MILEVVSTISPTSVPVYSEQIDKILDLGYTATSVLVFMLLMVVVWLLYRLFKFIF